MIVWINGAFGSGKTTTGTLVAEREPRLRLFDPESVGYLLRDQLSDQDVSDFQELASWRRIVPVVADEVIRATGQHLVAIQTVLVEQYWVELMAGMETLGHEVFHVVLEADEDVTRTRIEIDELDPGAREWRLQHLEHYSAARDWLSSRADLVLDTSALAPEAAAATVRRAVGNRLA